MVKIKEKIILLLMPSKIQGVGVFSSAPIKKGTWLSELFSRGDYRFIPNKEAKKFPIPQLLDHYCVRDERGYHCPRSFNRMSIGWFLNHSDNPNVAHKNFRYYALRDIAADEELVIDYRTLDEPGEFKGFQS